MQQYEREREKERELAALLINLQDVYIQIKVQIDRIKTKEKLLISLDQLASLISSRSRGVAVLMNLS